MLMCRDQAGFFKTTGTEKGLCFSNTSRPSGGGVPTPNPFLFHQDNTSWPATLLGTELISPEKKLGKLPGSPFRLYILEGHKARPEAVLSLFLCSR